MKRITVLFGNYGSGKTELAINLALLLSRTQDNVTLIDLDIVNPYFRSSEQSAKLNNNGIRVVSPVFANTAVDVPALPPEIYSSFVNGYAVFDCGGDAVGASALGSLHSHFVKVRGECEVLFVVNSRRPFQEDIGQLRDSISRVQKSARLNADGIVLNTNLGSQTTGQDLALSFDMVSRIEKKDGIPIKYISGTKDVLSEFSAMRPNCTAEQIEITPYTRPQWL